jgi:enterochelin esterase-like enzyme
VFALFAEARRRLLFVPAVTLGAVVAVLAAAVRFHVPGGQLPLTVTYRYAFTPRSPVTGGWSRLISSQVLTRDTFMLISIVVSLIVTLGIYEAVAGHSRATAVAVVTGLVGPLGVAAALGIGAALGSGFAARTLSTPDFGASAITAGAGGALVAVLGWRRLRYVAVAFVLGGLVFHHQLADWEHLVSFTTGYGLGRWLGVARCDRRTAMSRTSPRVRVGGAIGLVGVIALAVAGSAAVVPAGTGAAVVATAATRTPASGPGRSDTRHQISPMRLVTTTFPAPALGQRQGVLVVLPAGYDSGIQRYPVVEYLHGSPGTPEDVLVQGNLLGVLASPDIPPLIAVLPDGHTPAVDNGDFADTSRQKLGTAMSDDLQAWVNGTYRTDGHWGVAGLSSGGYGAAYLGARSGHRYQAVCAMGGYFAADPEVFASQTRETRRLASPLYRVASDGPPTLLISSSNDEPFTGDAIRYRAALARAGQPVYATVVQGRHEWDAWGRMLPSCLAFAATGSFRAPTPDAPDRPR